jgi:ribosomal protein S12 methylthiotransferase accessory factor
MLKAAAEMYERLSCNSRFNAVAIDDHIDMNLPSPEMVRFAEWQYAQPDFPYSRTVSKNWTRGGDPISGNAARFPSQLVFFLNESSSEPTCGQVTSNGVATHTIQGKALLASAYELIERDALMIHWFNRIPRESISAPSHLAGRIAHLEDLGFSVRLINLSLDVGPVILAVLRRRTCGFPGIALGLGAHPSPLIAATKALDEASLTTTALDDPVPSLCSPREVISIFDHQLWYSQPENQHELDFFESGIMVPIEAIAFGPRTVRELRSVFTRNGLQWYVVEMNSDGRRRTGLWTFRSVVPGLIPITFGYGLEPLGMSRLWEVPSRLGFKTNGYRISQGGYRVQPFS